MWPPLIARRTSAVAPLPAHPYGGVALIVEGNFIKWYFLGLSRTALVPALIVVGLEFHPCGRAFFDGKVVGRVTGFVLKNQPGGSASPIPYPLPDESSTKHEARTAATPTAATRPSPGGAEWLGTFQAARPLIPHQAR